MYRHKTSYQHDLVNVEVEMDEELDGVTLQNSDLWEKQSYITIPYDVLPRMIKFLELCYAQNAFNVLSEDLPSFKGCKIVRDEDDEFQIVKPSSSPSSSPWLKVSVVPPGSTVLGVQVSTEEEPEEE